MARHPRPQYEGALYHIYPRGNRRQRIAHTDRDYRTLERYFIEAALKLGVQPRAWYPMPNHFHAAIETPLGNLSVFMQTWLSRYARYYNRTYQKVGHLFQGRFGSRLVQSDAYLKELIRYIDLQRYRSKNPARIDPFCDRYASRRFYMGETCPPAVWAWIEPMLQLFGESPAEARRNYATFLADGLKEGDWEDFYKPTGGLVGTEAFVKAVEQRCREKENPMPLPPRSRRRAIRLLLESAVALSNIPLDELTSASQRRPVCRLRRAIAYAGRRLGLKVNELAGALRRGHPAVSAMLQAAERQPLRESEKLLRRVRANL